VTMAGPLPPDDEPIPNRCWRRRGADPAKRREAELASARRLKNRDAINAKLREKYRLRRLLEGRPYSPRLDGRRP
jgi:hypothetical protein